jgi:hypothetical protein
MLPGSCFLRGGGLPVGANSAPLRLLSWKCGKMRGTTKNLEISPRLFAGFTPKQHTKASEAVRNLLH